MRRAAGSQLLKEDHSLGYLIVPTRNYHIKKIFEDAEFQEDSVIRIFRITAGDNKTYSVNHYSLQMVIAVGFKVNSERARNPRRRTPILPEDNRHLRHGGGLRPLPAGARSHQQRSPPSINNPFPQPSQTKPPSVKDGGLFLAGVSPPTYLLCRRQIVV